MKAQAKVIAVGNAAIDAKEPMVILFDEHATPAIQDVAVIQRFVIPAEQAQLTLSTASVISVDQQDYAITYMGALVNANLNSIGHVALVFGPAPKEDQLQSGVYLTPLDAKHVGMPEFKVGTQISYQESK